MKKFLCIAGIICIFTCCSFSQEQKKVLQYNEAYKSVLYRNLDSAFMYANKALKITEVLEDNNLLLEVYANLSEVYYYKRDYNNSRKYSSDALNIALKLSDIEKEAVLYNRLGSLKRKNGDYVKALSLYEKTLKLSKENKFKKLESSIYTNLARLYRINNDSINMRLALNKAIKIGNEGGFKINLIESYNILGIDFLSTNKDSSIYYYTKALIMAKEKENVYWEGVVLSNLGDVYLSIKQYSKAFYYLHKAEDLTEDVGDNSSLHFINMSLGIYYETLDDFPNAILKYRKAIDEYGSFVDIYQKMRANYIVSGIYYHNKNYKQAYLYQETYLELNDSILSIEKAKEFDEIRTQYEVEKKENQIALLKIKSKLEITRRKNLIILSLSILIPLLLLLLFYRHRVKTQRLLRKKEDELHKKEKERLQKEQQLIQVQAQIKGQDKERNRIAKELHDGIGGQLASLNLSLTHINSQLDNKEIKDVNKSLSSTFKELRILSHNLSSNYFKDKDFNILLLDLKHQYETSNGFVINVSVFPNGSLKILNESIKHNIYRILQELLNNVTKHANASIVELSFNMHSKVLIMMFEDNGNGFDNKLITKGIGLSNIKERVKLLNGKITIDSELNEGTHITIEIPK